MITEPIIVYEADETTFTTNGLRILSPMVAEYTLEFNQAGSVHLEHPIDEYGDWKTLAPWNIIRCPIPYRGSIKYQPFRIYRRVKKRASDGRMVVSVDALHMFYDLNYVVLEDVRPTELSCQAAIQWLFDHAYNPAGNLPTGNFTYASNISATATSYFIWKTLAGALIGEDNCVLNRWNGELYVDGLYFSIKDKMENSLEDAFFIIHGINLSEVEESVDVTDTFSRFVASDNFGNVLTDSVALSHSGIPYEKTLHASFSYDEEAEEADRLAQFQADFAAYMDKIQEISVGYTVSIHELPHDDPFRALEAFEVGDSGKIVDEDMGIETTQRIMKKTIDLLSGDIISIETGNLAKSIAKSEPFSNTVTIGESALQKQINTVSSEVSAMETSRLRTWGSAYASGMKWSEAANYKWGEAGT